MLLDLGDEVEALDQVSFLFEGGVDRKEPLADDDEAEAKSTDYLDDLKQAEVRDYLHKQLLGMDFEGNLQPVWVVFKIRIRWKTLHKRLSR